MKAAIYLFVCLAVSASGSVHKLATTTMNPTTKQPVYTAPPTIDPAYVLEHSPFTCHGLIDSYYADVSFDCKFYHQCQVFSQNDGEQYIQHTVVPCGGGTLFNQTTKACDYADVSCDPIIVEGIVRDQQNMSIPTPGPSKAKPIPATSFRCSQHEHKNGFYFADEETLCETYHKQEVDDYTKKRIKYSSAHSKSTAILSVDNARCVYHNGEELTYAVQFTFTCPEGLLFNQTIVSCMDSNSVKCINTRSLWNDQSYLYPNF